MSVEKPFTYIAFHCIIAIATFLIQELVIKKKNMSKGQKWKKSTMMKFI